MSIFIFRRDHRLDDNTGLIKACTESDKVYPIFIINPTKILEIAVPINRLIGNVEIKKIGKIIANFL